MKKFTCSLLTIMALGVAGSQAALYTLSGTMDPQQAGSNGGFGGGTGSGIGTIIGEYDDVTNILDYTITWQNLSAPITVAHVHGPAAPGSNAGVVFGISTTSPATGTRTLSAVEESQLLGGLWYANIHTQAFTGGEIRGQVNTTVIPEPGSAALALAAAGLVLLRRRRS